MWGLRVSFAADWNFAPGCFVWVDVLALETELMFEMCVGEARIRRAVKNVAFWAVAFPRVADYG